MKGIKKIIGGFTLIEVMVATAILGATLIGPVALLSTSLTRSDISTDQLSAFYLADEGIEFIHRHRDNNILAQANWRQGLADGDYEFDYSDPSLNAASTLAPPSYVGIKIKFDSTTGFYNYTTGDDTKFIRKITLSTPTDDDAPIGGPNLTTDRMDVTVLVMWQDHGSGPQKSVHLQERLYNWQ